METKQQQIERVYYNTVQLTSLLIDPTFLFAEWGRGSGKTEGVMGPRFVRVSHAMPHSTLVFAGPTYVSLMQNIVPKLIKYFNHTQKNGQQLLTEGVHYVIGAKDLPKHFKRPFAPIIDPKHSISTVWGSTARLVSSDRPESAAGVDAAHAFVEEMKHNDGKKMKSRIFPTLRDDIRSPFADSHYFQGITGVSDTARVDLGEDNWFEEYEKNMKWDIIEDIANVSKYVEDAKLQVHLEKNVEKNQKIINRWTAILNEMRKGQTYYARASSFVNKDVLGYNFFANMIKSLSKDEFLSSIAAIRPKKVGNMFFGKFSKKHIFKDTYMYDYIEKYDLRDSFKITSRDLKHYNPHQPLYWGFDPGGFMSCVVGQRKPDKKELRMIKDFWVYNPKQHTELAKEFNDFFGEHRKNRNILMYYDRAANQKKRKDSHTMFGDRGDTDAKIMKRELEKYGWHVELMNLGQRTIFFWEHFNLLNILLSEKDANIDKIRICENQCDALISSIYCSPLKRSEGRIELDKKAERELEFEKQAYSSPQIATSLMYLLFGLYEKYLPTKSFVIPDFSPVSL